jgi:hypothetical protein
MEALSANFLTQPTSFKKRRSPLIWSVLLALLFHALVIGIHVPSFFLKKLQSPPRVEVKTVDVAQIEALKKKWREKNQQLLLSKSDPSLPRENLEAPKDARYFSDRNIRVEKEQRAKNTAPLPQTGAAPNEVQTKAASPSAQDLTQKPNLSKLGVPMPAPMNSPRTKQSRIPMPSPPKTPGGDQAIAEKDLPLGSQNLLNAQESVYYSFYSRIYEALSPAWHRRINQLNTQGRIPPGDYTTQLDVVFDKNGALKQVRALTTSHVDEFDQAAIASWNQLGPFPNPPRALLNEAEEVHTGWTFTVQINEGLVTRSQPPEKIY